MGLEDLQALVLDEADRLLEMGFAEEVCTTRPAGTMLILQLSNKQQQSKDHISKHATFLLCGLCSSCLCGLLEDHLSLVLLISLQRAVPHCLFL